MKKIREKPVYSAFENVLYLLKDNWANDKVLLLYMLLESLFGVAAPFLTIWLPKLVVDGLQNHAAPGRILLTIGGFTLVLMAAYFMSQYNGSAKYWHYNFLRIDFLFV